MAQSDYLQYKKVSYQLKNLAEYDPVIAPSTYASFKQFTLVNTIKDTNIMYTKLLSPTYQNVFGMEKHPTNCPTYPLCINTQTRQNRKLMPLSNTIPICISRPVALKTAKRINPQKYSMANTIYCINQCLKEKTTA